MIHQEFIPTSRILALFLSLALALPSGVYAEPGRSTLRVMSPVDAGMEEQLAQKLDYHAAGKSPSAGLEEPQSTGGDASEGIRWAGDLETVQAIAGYPHRVFLPLHLNLPGREPNQLNGSLELVLVVDNNGHRQEFQIPEEKRSLFDGLHGPYQANHRLGVELPEDCWPLLEQAGHLRYWFRYRLKGQAEWKDTSTLPPAERGIGEIVYQPRWLFESAIYTVNVKAWGSFEAVRRRLPDLDRLGAKILLLQGIHPGHTNFEIDDFEAADPKLGSEQELNRLIQEAKAKGFKVLIPFVPNHASPKNRWLQEKDHLFKRVSTPGKVPQEKTVTVTVRDQPVAFLRGNVYHDWVPQGEIPDGFGPGTVQFDLWDQEKRRELADLWIKVLGSWVQRGIDGFYADTGHSVNFIAPGWLEEIRRGLQANHPGTVFGCEAHWQQAEGFIQRGMSFAQDFFLYDDWLRALVYGYKGLDPRHPGAYRDAKGLMEFLRAQSPDLLQQKLTFLENHDEDSLAFHVCSLSHVPESLKLPALKAFSTLLILGIPGIPLLNNGQESGNQQRWMVTGHTWEYDHQYDWGRAPNAPAFEKRLDPFADQSPEAEDVRHHCARLLEIRRNNESFWWGPGTQFLETGDSNTCVSYRAAGEKRALVIINVDRSSHDPGKIATVRLDLSKFGLNREERLRIRQALEQVPPDFKPHGWTFDPENVASPILWLQLKPFQTVVLEWEAPARPAAGLEEEGSGSSQLMEKTSSGDWEQQMKAVLKIGYGETADSLTETDLLSIRKMGADIRWALRANAAALGVSLAEPKESQMLQGLTALNLPDLAFIDPGSRERMFDAVVERISEPVREPLRQLVTAPTWEEFIQQRVPAAEEAIAQYVETAPPGVFWPGTLAPLIERDFNQDQTQVIADVTRRLLRAWAPEMSNPNVEEQVAWFLPRIQPPHLRGIIQRIIQMGIPYYGESADLFRTELKRRVAALVVMSPNMTSWIRDDPRIIVSWSRAGSVPVFAGFLAHEIVHGLIGRWKLMERFGREEWSRADWITRATQVILSQQIAQERGEKLADIAYPAIGPKVWNWLYEAGRKIARTKTDTWTQQFTQDYIGLFLPEQAHYAVGILIAGLAQELGEEVVQKDRSYQASERALYFVLNRFARHSANRISLDELGEAARQFRRDHDLPEEHRAAGLEERVKNRRAVVQEILQGLKPTEEESQGVVLIGPEALLGAQGVPPLGPILEELKSRPEWERIRQQVVIYTEDEKLPGRLDGYPVFRWPAQVRDYLAEISARRITFYQAGDDWLLHGQFEFPEGLEVVPVLLTRKDFAKQLADLFTILGYVPPAPEELEPVVEVEEMAASA